MKTSIHSISDHQLDQLGHALAQQIRQQAVAHDVGERLRIARSQAVARAHLLAPAHVSHLKLNTVNASELALAGANGSGRGFGFRMWLGLGSALPLLSLVVGLFFLSGFHSQKWLNEVTRIDSALLADELPPDAYTDSGFLAFLNAEKAVSKEEVEDETASADKPVQSDSK